MILLLILVIVATLAIVRMYKAYDKCTRARALEAARTAAALAPPA